MQVIKQYYPKTFIVPYNDTFKEYNKSSIKQNIQRIVVNTIDCGGK